jgi:hypothetical protein
MPKLQFIPECHAETTMVAILFEGIGYHNHAPGIGNVSHKLKKNDLAGYINIGFVDKDKNSIPTYFDEFEVQDQIENVIFKKHPQNNDYLIIVDKNIERFILSQLDEIGKKPSDYNLPDDRLAFSRITKKISIEKNEGYRQLIHELKEKKPSGIQFIYEKVMQFHD